MEFWLNCNFYLKASLNNESPNESERIQTNTEFRLKAIRETQGKKMVVSLFFGYTQEM